MSGIRTRDLANQSCNICREMRNTGPCRGHLSGKGGSDAESPADLFTLRVEAPALIPAQVLRSNDRVVKVNGIDLKHLDLSLSKLAELFLITNDVANGKLTIAFRNTVSLKDRKAYQSWLDVLRQTFISCKNELEVHGIPVNISTDRSDQISIHIPSKFHYAQFIDQLVRGGLLHRELLTPFHLRPEPGRRNHLEDEQQRKSPTPFATQLRRGNLDI